MLDFILKESIDLILIERNEDKIIEKFESIVKSKEKTNKMRAILQK